MGRARVSDRRESIALGEALATAKHVFLADWTGGATETREFEFRSRRFTLPDRVFTLIEDLSPPDLGVQVAGVFDDEPVLKSPRSAADSPSFGPGTRIRVYDGQALDRQVGAELHPGKNRILRSYEPPRAVTEGRVILILGGYRADYEAFAAAGMAPPELLDQVRELLKRRE